MLARLFAVPVCRDTATALLCTAAILLGACAGPSLKDQIEQEESLSLPPASEGILFELAQEFRQQYGAEASGFRLLDSSFDGLSARLALIDSAVSSLDIQTYLWYPDNSGRLVLERAVEAAERGVHVRMLVDDLLTIGLDQTIYELNLHPNIEFRLFNPWEDRSTLARGGEMVARFGHHLAVTWNLGEENTNISRLQLGGSPSRQLAFAI